MSWLWSNPTPSNATFASESAQAHLQAPEIGHLIAAILKNRQQQQQQTQQGISSFISGIGKLGSGIEQGQQQGQANDAANRAMYLAQNPGEQSTLADLGSDQFDQQRVPDYGGTDALKLQKIEEELTDKHNLMGAQTRAANALADKRWTPGSDDTTTRREQIIDTSRLKGIQEMLDGSGVTPNEVLNSKTTFAGDYDKTGTFQNYRPTGDQYHPAQPSQQQIAVGGDPNAAGSYAKVFPSERFNDLKNAAQQYISLQRKLALGSEGASNYPTPSLPTNSGGNEVEPPPLMGNTTAGATPSPSPAPTMQSLAGATRVVNGITYKWDGQSWNPVQQQ